MSIKQVSARLTIKQAAAAFGVTSVTLFAWRKGIPGRTPLPVEIEGEGVTKPRVFVPIEKARTWAIKHNLEFKPETIEAAGRSTKPGPKPKVEKARKSRTAQQPH